MQTFLPYKDFVRTAKVLDSKRLNKQILEGYQLLKVLSGGNPKAAWYNHPAARMWAGHEGHLWDYIMVMVDEANERGIKTDKNLENLHALKAAVGADWNYDAPDWFSDSKILNRVVTTHKANLYNKDSVYYVHFNSYVNHKYNKPCCEGCNYFWVSHLGRS